MATRQTLSYKDSFDRSNPPALWADQLVCSRNAVVCARVLLHCKPVGLHTEQVCARDEFSEEGLGWHAKKVPQAIVVGSAQLTIEEESVWCRFVCRLLVLYVVMDMTNQAKAQLARVYRARWWDRGTRGSCRGQGNSHRPQGGLKAHCISLPSGRLPYVVDPAQDVFQ